MRAVIAFLFCLITFNAYAAKPLAGNISGKPWTFLSGIAKVSATSGQVNLSFWSIKESNACTFANGSMRQIKTTVAAKVGAYNIKDGQKIVFDGSYEAIPAKKGKIVITKIEDGMIYGTLDISYDKENDVKGDFAVSLCEANFPSCIKFDGRWQNSDVVYYLEHENKDCSSVEFYKKRILPPYTSATVSFIADGQVHENELAEGPYTAKLDMNGLTIQTEAETYRYVIANGYCNGKRSLDRTLLRQTLNPSTGAVVKCYLVGFEM